MIIYVDWTTFTYDTIITVFLGYYFSFGALYNLGFGNFDVFRILFPMDLANTITRRKN